MAATLASDIAILRALLTGSVVDPRTPGYDEARKVWNADVDCRPVLVARCATPADVTTSLGFARAHGLPIAVRGGGHSVGGAGTVNDGLVIDLSRMNQVVVDPVAKRARVGGGALTRELDAATQAHGLAVPTGVVSHTGIGGLTLGGGMGWLTRFAGLTIDNLVSAEVVTADGRVRRVGEDEYPDLFWALRGGGGNFGVVTEFEFRLLEVGPTVHLGFLYWGLDQGAEILRLAREVIPTLSRRLNVLAGGVNAPPAPFVPARYQFQPGYVLLVTGFGTAEEHAAAIADIRAELSPVVEFVSPMSYQALQQLLDEANAWGHYGYQESTYLLELTDAAIEVITEQVPERASPLSLLLLYRLDGAYSEMGEEDTAFSGGRSPRYSAFVVGESRTAQLLEHERAWVRSCWQALVPHAEGIGCYVNGMSEYQADRVRAAYGAKYKRLAGIKAGYDPGNLFRRNQNITPG